MMLRNCGNSNNTTLITDRNDELKVADNYNDDEFNESNDDFGDSRERDVHKGDNSDNQLNRLLLTFGFKYVGCWDPNTSFISSWRKNIKGGQRHDFSNFTLKIKGGPRYTFSVNNFFIRVKFIVFYIRFYKFSLEKHCASIL